MNLIRNKFYIDRGNINLECGLVWSDLIKYILSGL